MKNIYVIRHKKSGKLLQKTWPVTETIKFMDWGIPKTFTTLVSAKEAMDLIDAFMYINLNSEDLEIVNTHNSIEKEKWTVITE